ncbi:MAG: hypothetical protein AAFX94_13210, partial [Myxococcota bacterium]
MILLRVCLFALLLAFLVAGCSEQDEDQAATDQTVGTPAETADLMGYRESAYDTHFPTERVNLNGSRSLSNVGFDRNVDAGDVEVSTIPIPYPVMLYTRNQDEIFVLGGTPLILEDNVASIDGLPPGDNETSPYFAKYSPSTGAITSVDLDRGQGLPYVGGALVHADGFVYVVSQSHLYKFNPATMAIESSLALPVLDPLTFYNGLTTGRTGELILKATRLVENGGGLLVLVDGASMEIVFSDECACATPRLSLAVDENGVEHVYHLNRQNTFRYIVEPGLLTLDENWIIRFDPDGTGINEEPTSPAIVNGNVYYTTNTARGSPLPMRVFWQSVNQPYTPDMPALTGPLLFTDPEEQPGWTFGGISGDEASGILFGQDQARGLLNAFTPSDDGSIDILWQRPLTVGSSGFVVSDREVLYATDYSDGANHLVVL